MFHWSGAGWLSAAAPSSSPSLSPSSTFKLGIVCWLAVAEALLTSPVFVLVVEGIAGEAEADRSEALWTGRDDICCCWCGGCEFAGEAGAGAGAGA